MSYTRRTTIDQHQGEHQSGMRIMQLTEIVTDLSAHAERPYDELPDADRAWWNRVVDAIHEAECGIAALDADERRAVREELEARADEAPDLEDRAAWLVRIAEDTLIERAAVKAAAATLGRKGGRIGGRARSEAKAHASRANGAKGGRPRKPREE